MARKKTQVVCSFCEKPVKEVGVVVEGNGSTKPRICQACNRTCYEIFSLRSKEQSKSLNLEKYKSPLENIYPKKIKEFLDQSVIGQDKAKYALSISLYNHYKRILKSKKEVEKNYKDVTIEKTNVMLVGPTGSGKTHLAKSIAKFLDVPFAIGDATSLTEAGYVGDDVESLLSTLVRNADFNIDAAQVGIIYIDEIDKIARSKNNVSISKDVSGEGVQQSLLKLIEGTVSSVPPNGGRKHPETKLLHIDTSNILFICGGTFNGIDEIIQKRTGKRKMGFSSVKDETQIDQEILPEDLVEFGIIPEFIGRFPHIHMLEVLDKNDLVKVMTQTKNCLVKQYEKSFAIDSVELKFDIKAVELIAENAIKMETGARGLAQIMERVMFDFNYRIDEYKNKKLIVKEIDVKKALNQRA